MSETVFSYKTRGGSTPNNKPKVYFTCHPDDFARYFKDVSHDILEAVDCCIFYTEDLDEALSDENTLVDLERMHLFVIPVTFKLLTTANRAMDFDFRFAKEKHIPILPLLMEPGIYEFYKRPEGFGELQYLKPCSTDSTSIDYEIKLKKYLDDVLISDELIKRIRAEFDSYIFLSYRKKDRKKANELIKLIHNISGCEDIAIWFDEFLIPGQSFRESIETKIAESKLFILLVTPRILEKQPDGSPNFIMREEYPMAKKLGKRILPIEIDVTDGEELSRNYKDIPECIKIEVEESYLFLPNKVAALLSELAIPHFPRDHYYLIGLAYIKGVDVEIDTDKGVALITRAAGYNCAEAIYELYSMYKNGYYVKQDYEQSLFWAKRLHKLTVDLFGDSGNVEPFATSLSILGNAYYLSGDYNNAIKYQTKAYEISVNVFGGEDGTTLSSIIDLALAFQDIGRVDKSIELLKPCYMTLINIRGEEDKLTLQVMNNLASLYDSNENYKEAFDLHRKCYSIRCKLFGEDNPDTLQSLCNLAIAYMRLGENDIAVELLEKCYLSMCIAFGEEHPDTLYSLNALASVYDSLKEYSKSYMYFEKCYKIRLSALGENHPATLRSLNNLAREAFLCGNIKASGLFKKCYDSLCIVLGKEHPTTLKVKHNLEIASRMHSFVNTKNTNEVTNHCDYSVDIIKTKLLLSKKKINYNYLVFCQSDSTEVSYAIAQYASDVKPEDVIAIDNRTKEFFGIGKARGILYTRVAIFSSYSLSHNPIRYRDIKHVAPSVNGIRFKMQNGENFDCDFGRANEFIIDFLSELGKG